MTLFSVMLCKPRVRTLAFAGWAVWACALPDSPPPTPDAGAEGGTGNTAAGGPVGGTSGTAQGGTTAGSTSGGSTSGGSTSGGSTSGGSTTGGSGGSTGGTTAGSSGSSTGGVSGAGGTGGTGGSSSGMGGTVAGAGAGGTGGTVAGAGMGGTMAGAGAGGKGGAAGTGGSAGKAGILAHRYAFSGTDTNAMDSVGTAHGTIMGGTQSGGVVTLMGGTSDQYVQLPPTVLNGLTNATFEVWATWTGGTSNWQRIWDFGTSDAGDGAQGSTNASSPYFFFTPRAQATANPNCTNNTASMPRVAITGAGPSAEDCAFGTAAFPMGTLTHVAVVIDGTTMTLYIGGSAVGGPVTLSVGVANVSGYANNWLGRSQFTSDTEYAGTISEFRIYNVARTSSQISASASAGPDTPPTQ